MLYEYNDFRLSSKLMDLAHKLVVRYVIAYMACFKHGIEFSPHFSNCAFKMKAHWVNKHEIHHLQ